MEEPIDEMPAEILPGRPGNLTPEQEESLRQLWARLFQIWGMTVEEQSAETTEQPADSKDSKDSKPDKEKKKKRSLFSRKSKKDTDTSTESSKSTADDVAQSVNGKDDKFGQTKVFLDAMAAHSPEELRSMLWTMVKHDDPDALLLRFLRARKWDIEKAIVMLISTLDWRNKEMHVDDDIMLKGELAALQEESSSDPKVKKEAADFMAQLRMGKSFVHGTDGAGRPVCIVRTHLHRQGEQSEQSLERATVFIIETTRFLLEYPVDTATIVFDMTNFSMANMDYTPVKFIIKVFEANYPECLGSVLVHKAPWVFQGIWRIIRGWLDPVVAAKVHFTNNLNEIDEFIPRSQLLKELEGDEDWEYSYKEPVPGENDAMKDTESRDKLIAVREKLFKEYEEATMEWLQNPKGEPGKAAKSKRSEIVKQMKESYWQLDPYIRARSLYDRIGIIGPGGKLDFKATGAGAGSQATDPPKVNGTAVETSADDVD